MGLFKSPEEKKYEDMHRVMSLAAVTVDSIYTKGHSLSSKWIDARCSGCNKKLPISGFGKPETYLKPDGTLFVICIKCGLPMAVVRLKCIANVNPSRSFFSSPKACEKIASCYYNGKTGEPRCSEHKDCKPSVWGVKHESLIQAMWG